MKLNPSRFKNLFKTNWVLKLASFLIAVVVWFAVVISMTPEQEYRITDVPVTLNMESSAAGERNLQPIAGQDATVTVVVRGKRSVVGGLTKNDVVVSGILNYVVAAGVYDVPLQVQKTDPNADFTVVRVEPLNVSITFDEIIEKVVPVRADVSITSVPDGYIMRDPVLEYTEVTLTGPRTALANVEYCGVTLQKEGTFTSDIVENLEISAYNADGEKLEDTDFTYSSKTTKITVPILKEKTVNLTYQIINAPADLDTSQLQITLSQSTLQVAAPEALADSIDSISLGYIDVKDLSPGAQLTLKIELPNGFINMEDTEEVTATFMSEGVNTRTFRVTNIQTINVPTGYSVRVYTSSLSNVQLVAIGDQLEDLAASEIVAEADLSQIELTAGQSTSIPVSIRVPGRDGIWAVGSYTIVIAVWQTQ